VVLNRAKNRAKRLNIVVSAPFLDQLVWDSFSTLSSGARQILTNGYLVFLDTEASGKSHKFVNTYEVAALSTNDYVMFYANRTNTAYKLWNVSLIDRERNQLSRLSNVSEIILSSQLLRFFGNLTIAYYASANAVDLNRLEGLLDVNKLTFSNIGYEITFRLFGPHGNIKTPDLCQATIHKYMFAAGGIESSLSGF